MLRRGEEGGKTEDGSLTEVGAREAAETGFGCAYVGKGVEHAEPVQRIRHTETARNPIGKPA